MKAMNYLFIAAFVLLLGACSNENQTEDYDLQTTELRGNENREVQEVFELDWQQYYTIGQLNQLKNKKTELEEAIQGGNENLLPVLESVIYKIDANYNRLNSILDKVCTILEIRAKWLSQEANNGNKDAAEELKDLEKRFEKCGIDARDYVQQVSATYAFLIIGKDDGGDGRCIPTGNDCPAQFDAGKLLINIEEDEADSFEAEVTTPEGEVIGKGEIIGAHNEFEGLLQVVLELEPIESAVVNIKSESGSYKAFINMR